MSGEFPIIPTPTQAIGIDAVISDLQTHLDFDLVWLTNGLGRAYRLTKVRHDKSVVFMPEVYLGTPQSSYYAAIPDNKKTGQNFFLVGDAALPNYQTGFFGILEYDVAIIFSANLQTINDTLLLTDYFAEHLIENVRNSLIRGLIGKAYKLVIKSIEQDFEDVYTEFDIANDRGIAHAPMTHFRFNCTIQLRENCSFTALNRCAAILQNLTQTDLLDCILPTYNFADLATQAAVTVQQVADLTTWLCMPCPPFPRYSTIFDGANERVELPYNAAQELERTDSFTIDVWVKISSYTFGAIIEKFDFVGIRRGWSVWTLNTGEVVFELSSNESTSETVATGTIAQIPLNTWTRVTVVYEGTSTAAGVTMYLNQVSTPYTIYQDNLTTTTVDPTNVVTIGGIAPAFFAGKIFEAMVYKNRALTALEVAALPLYTDTPQYESDLVVWCSMGQGSIFGVDTRVYPDKTTLTSGAQSFLMEVGDISTDIPI